MEAEREPRKVNDGLVSLVKIKERARRMLPTGSAARGVIVAEKNALPLAEAVVKLEVFDRLLCSELGA